MQAIATNVDMVGLITFRSGDKLDTDAMWDALCEDCVVNEISHMIALLVTHGCIDRILTSNFDHVLEEACGNVGVRSMKMCLMFNWKRMD